MLANNFYTIDDLNHASGLITATILFNADHPIFKGHFPSIPVVPGVCMMQLVKETLEHATEMKTSITKAGQLKFLSLIVPTKTPKVDVRIQYSRLDKVFDISAELRDTDRVYFKMKAMLTTP